MKQRSLILVFNCGSSSIKFAVVDPDNAEKPLHGILENIASPQARLHWQSDTQRHTTACPHVNYTQAIQSITTLLTQHSHLTQSIIGVGHRVVHGGERFKTATVITEDVIAAIQANQTLAPLHNPANLSGIQAAQQTLGHLPHVAVFDTAFHQTMPKQAYLYALPYEWYTQHQIRRYGFHGISHHYVSQEAAQRLHKSLESLTLIVAHLGNGASLCAVKQGKSVDTTMGFTPLAGLVMGTRCGDIDPGIHYHLTQNLGYTAEQIHHFLNHHSGLLGISGLSRDMRELIAASEQNHPRAKLAIEIFCYQLAKYIAALVVPLGKLDALVFTGGIGENAALIRQRVLQQLPFLDFHIDPDLNAQHGKTTQGLITLPHSTPAFVIPTNEELLIAKQTFALLT